jgi:hypothetical protein
MCSEELAQVELEWEDGARQINDCEYLYIDSIRELEELTLGLVVAEAKLQAQILVPRDKRPVEQMRLGAKSIERDVTCRRFRLIFDRKHMVSYTVLNESYGRYPESPERRHYEIACLNHVVDVISAGPPRIAIINGRDVA